MVRFVGANCCILWSGVLVAAIVALLPTGVRSQDAEFSKDEIDIFKTKCEVCKTAVKILFNEVQKTDPSKVVNVGSFRLQADGTVLQKKVPYRGSESQLHDLLDEGKVCGGMKDYVPVTDKKTGLPTMINMVDDMDKMHQVNFNPNPDFNSKMNTFHIYRPGGPDPEQQREEAQRKIRLCEEIVGDHEDDLMSLFKHNIRTDGVRTTPYDFGREFCIRTTKLCDPSDDMETLKPTTASPEGADADAEQDDNDIASLRGEPVNEEELENYEDDARDEL